MIKRENNFLVATLVCIKLKKKSGKKSRNEKVVFDMYGGEKRRKN